MSVQLALWAKSASVGGRASRPSAITTSVAASAIRRAPVCPVPVASSTELTAIPFGTVQLVTFVSTVEFARTPPRKVTFASVSMATKA